MKNHQSARSKAKGKGDDEKFKFEQECVTECERRIQRAQEELQSL
ncbi:hypothetical protein V9L05_01480 [Bernardetia sp. Wsw4-3y2]